MNLQDINYKQAKQIYILTGGVCFLFIAIILGAYLFILKDYRSHTTCSSFRNYSSAQTALPDYPNLDKDKDGLPCENKLP